MAYLEMRDVCKEYAGVRTVNNVSFTAEKGEILALLGPSGCGKTTLLNMIAGFLPVDGGSIHLNNRDLSSMPPHKRDMSMVFQSYALFPHMTIAENVGFGLAMRGVPKPEIQKRVAAALEAVQLKGVAERYPRQLSGGQQQRVALTRAMVVRPAVLLLDEPLSNLDALLRKTMRDDMRELLKAEGITAILVTHDQEEALVAADRIILMSAGQVEQIATPTELYERPRTVFCARFMDVPNLLDGTIIGIEGDCAAIETSVGVLKAQRTAARVGDSVTLAVRPENIALGSDGGDNRAAGRVVRDTYHGAVRRLDVAIGTHTMVMHIPVKCCSATTGDQLALSWKASDTLVLANTDSSPGPAKAKNASLPAGAANAQNAGRALAAARI
jgi:putative spermidine/putrescine transport system ATP-binding protein